MISRVGTVSIFVENQDRAKAFYTETLGMDLISDDEIWPGADSRWLSVAPAGAETQIVLYKFDDNWGALPLDLSAITIAYAAMREY